MKKNLMMCIIPALAIYHINAIASVAGSGLITPGGEVTSSNCNNESYWKVCMGGGEISYSGCTASACKTCEDGLITEPQFPNSYGVVTTTTHKYTPTCPYNGYGNATCSCKETTTYSCGSGYYGTATSQTAGCTKCPSNATCSGGNDSTFTCYKNYYKNGTTCTACPSSGLTESTGATDITKCYITTFSDSTGSGQYTSRCYYTK